MKWIKFLLISIFFTQAFLEVYSQAKLENQVIADLLKSGNKLIPEYVRSKNKGRVKKFDKEDIPDFVLLNVTRSPLKDAEFDTASMFQKKVLSEKDMEMLYDFCGKNKSLVQIKMVGKVDANITYISSKDFKKVYTDKDGWHTYYGIYGLKPLVNVSRPGFNLKKNKAFIYISYSLGKNDGAGYYLVMKKCLWKWRIRGNMLIWVS